MDTFSSSINRDSEQNDKMSHRKAFGFNSMSEHVLNFVLVKKYLIYTLYHSIDSLYSTNSVNVYVPSENQQFRYKIARGW